jgi:hypothetical protein
MINNMIQYLIVPELSIEAQVKIRVIITSGFVALMKLNESNQSLDHWYWLKEQVMQITAFNSMG